jgi:hypothetical protein
MESCIKVFGFENGDSKIVKKIDEDKEKLKGPKVHFLEISQAFRQPFLLVGLCWCM